MVRRFLLKDVGRALNHWTGLWRERQRFKLIGRRMGADGGLSRAWRQWQLQAADDQRRKGIIGRFANVGLSRALNRWHESLEERRVMRLFLKRAMNGGLARALTSWFETMHQGALIATDDLPRMHVLTTARVLESGSRRCIKVR